MPINRWMDKEEVVHIHNGILLSHKKNEMVPSAATQMQLRLSYQVKPVRKRKTHTIWHHLYVDSKIWQNELLWKRNRFTGIVNRLVVIKREKLGGVMDWQVVASRCNLLYTEWVSNKVLLYSTENCIWHPEYTIMEKNMTKTLHFVHGNHVLQTKWGEAAKLEPISQAKAEENSNCAKRGETILSLYPTIKTSKIHNTLNTKMWPWNC